MKAVIFKKYGPPSVLQYTDIEKPSPKKNEVLLKVRAASVTMGDCELRGSYLRMPWWIFVRLMMGVFKPRVQTLGQEVAGEIVEIGSDVKNWKIGDQVFCGCGMNMGGYAEYARIPEQNLCEKPEIMSLYEAATVPVGGTNSMFFLDKVTIEKGTKILIVGAGGSIGTFGIQYALSKGAVVDCVDNSHKLDMLTQLGARTVIDFTKEDFWKRDEKYDVIFDVAGKTPFRHILKCLKREGVMLNTNPDFSGLFYAWWVRLTSKKRILTGLATDMRDDLEKVKTLIEKGIFKSVIERDFKLEEVQQAHEHIEAGKKQGSLVVKIND